ncbi:DUF982 domain-containing protein [Rhizobium wenxiniae]|uniref:DUF982 domain-containing protein n=1 Tax=Rhizobium wenxiniae TaxID=1737357 RepID=UPI001C6E5ED2|nr:DUF982 domain-containing protein [Rhizobium wenxiniae]MBW9088030.1 DUF982 domain-containing protein [Rhizobium wenxiniae]
METGAWKSPVVIEMYGRPGTVIVTGTLDAALMLIGAWPTKRTESHIAAVLSCRDVLVGQADAGLARVNFIEAALEAGYRIEPETFLSDRWDLTPSPNEPGRPALGLAELIRKRAIATVDRYAEDETDMAHQSEPAEIVTIEPLARIRETPPPRLRDLVGRLFNLLGLIGLEIGRSLVAPLSLSPSRRADRQVQ